jgi:8-amino-7-oxononanoate synthase
MPVIGDPGNEMTIQAEGRRRAALDLLSTHPLVKLAKYADDHGIPNRNFCIDAVDGARVIVGGRSRINFCSNDYLGLRHHPKVIAGAKAAIDRYGVGLGSSRLMSGNIALHYQLQERIADWLGRPAALLFTTGYQANLGLVSSLLAQSGEMLVEAGVHASAIDGARLAGAAVSSFERGSIVNLREYLRRPRSGPARAVMLDAIYSMDGGRCTLDRVAEELEERSDTVLIVDEAHSLGIVGPDGAGMVAASKSGARVDFITGTLSKCFGVIGGFVAGDADTIDALMVQSRPLIFSTATMPAALGGALAALDLMRGDPEGRRAHVIALSQRLRAGLTAIGADVWRSDSQIVPVVLGRPERAGMAAKLVAEAGLCCGLSVWPAVPLNKSMLRFSVNADQTADQIDYAVEVVAGVLRHLDAGHDGAAKPDRIVLSRSARTAS